jgi:hypothetical protein
MQVSMWIQKRIASYLKKTADDPVRLDGLFGDALQGELERRAKLLEEIVGDIAIYRSKPAFREMLAKSLTAQQELEEDVAFLEALTALFSRDREREIPDLLRHLLKELGCPKTPAGRFPVSLN